MLEEKDNQAKTPNTIEYLCRKTPKFTFEAQTLIETEISLQ